MYTRLDTQQDASKEHSSNATKPCPEEHSSLFSRLTFSWAGELLTRGSRNPIQEDDCWKLPENMKTEHVSKILESFWEKHKNRRRNGFAFAILDTFKARLMRMVALKLLIMALSLSSPWLLRALLDFVSDPKGASIFVGFGITFVLFAVQAVLAVVSQNYWWIGVHMSVMARDVIVATVYLKSLRMNLTQRKNYSAGTVVNLSSVDAGNVMHFLWASIQEVWASPLQIIVSFACLCWLLGWIPTVSGLAVMVVSFPITSWVTRTSAKLQELTLTTCDKRIRLMTEALSTMKFLKLYAMESYLGTKILEARDRQIGLMKQSSLIYAANTFLAAIVPSMISLVTFGVYVGRGNNLDASVAFTALTLFYTLKSPMQTLPETVSMLVRCYMSLQRLEKFLLCEEKQDYVTTGEQADGPFTLDPALRDGRVSIKDGFFDWETPSNQHSVLPLSPTPSATLKSISLNVEGKLAMVVGRVGSGKSSLVHSLLGEINRLKGLVHVPHRISYTPQTAWLLSDTVRGNITFNLDEDHQLDQNRYDTVLRVCSLAKDLEMWPKGDQTEIGEKGITLSGGQKQRVSLARAVYAESDCYIFDEPLGAVDAHVGKTLFEECIVRFLEGTTRILVTNQLQYLHAADVIIVMEDGRIQCTGTHAELLAAGVDFASLVKKQQEGLQLQPERITSTPHESWLHDAVLNGASSMEEDASGLPSLPQRRSIERARERLSLELQTTAVSRERGSIERLRSPTVTRDLDKDSSNVSLSSDKRTRSSYQLDVITSQPESKFDDIKEMSAVPFEVNSRTSSPRDRPLLPLESNTSTRGDRTLPLEAIIVTSLRDETAMTPKTPFSASKSEKKPNPFIALPRKPLPTTNGGSQHPPLGSATTETDEDSLIGLGPTPALPSPKGTSIQGPYHPLLVLRNGEPTSGAPLLPVPLKGTTGPLHPVMAHAKEETCCIVSVSPEEEVNNNNNQLPVNAKSYTATVELPPCSSVVKTSSSDTNSRSKTPILPFTADVSPLMTDDTSFAFTRPSMEDETHQHQCMGKCGQQNKKRTSGVMKGSHSIERWCRRILEGRLGLLKQQRSYQRMESVHEEDGEEKKGENHHDEKSRGDVLLTKLEQETQLWKRKHLHEGEKDAGTQSDKLVQDEQRAKGTSPAVYRQYYSAAGGLPTIVVVLLGTILAQVSTMSSDYWLALWSSRRIQPDPGLTVYLAVYALLSTLMGLFLALRTVLVALKCLLAAVRLHNGIFASLMRAPMHFFDSTPSGRIIDRCTKDQEIADQHLPHVVQDVLSCVTTCIGSAILICFVSPVAIIPMLLIGYMYRRIQTYYLCTSRELKRLEALSRAPMYTWLNETHSGLVCIRAHKASDRFRARAFARVDNNARLFFYGFAVNRWLGVRLEFVGALIVLVAAMSSLALKDIIGPGMVGLSVSTAMTLSGALNWALRQMSEMEVQMNAVERILQYMDIDKEAPLVIQETTPSKTWPERGQVKIRNLELRYRAGLEPVLKGISCEIRSGEKVGIVGRTGAGKSSLSLALFRIVEPCGGSIIIDNVDICSIGLHDLRRRLAIIPQEPVLFTGTIRSNLDPFGSCSDSELWDILQKIHLRQYVESLADGLDASADENGENFSVGQRQLICLGRALTKRSKVLIMDEATGSLDFETDARIKDFIRSNFANCTVLTIAHRLNTIMDSDRIIVMDGGRIVDFDTPSNLLAQPRGIFTQLVSDASTVLRQAESANV